MRLEQDQLRDLAELVAAALARRLHETVEGPDADGLVDAQAVATALGVSRDFVYRNAAALGGRRLGDGARPRLRFDLEEALEQWASCSARRTHDGTENRVAAPKPATRRRRRLGTSTPLLPIRGRSEAS